jgi:hypothetical protein
VPDTGVVLDTGVVADTGGVVDMVAEAGVEPHGVLRHGPPSSLLGHPQAPDGREVILTAGRLFPRARKVVPLNTGGP